MNTQNFKATKIIEVMKALPEQKLIRLRAFLSSPYFNTNESLLKLYDFLYQFAPTFSGEELTYQRAYDYIYPGKDYNVNGLNLLRHKFHKTLQLFLLHDSFQEDSFFKDSILIREFGKIGLKKKIEKIKQKTDKGKIKDTHFFFKKFLFEQELHRIYTANIHMQREKGLHELSPANAIETLDRFYVIQKLVYLCQLSNWSNRTKTQTNIQDDFTPIPHFSEEEEAVFHVWNLAFQLLQGNNNVRKKLQELLQKRSNLFSTNNVRNLAGYIQNDITRNVNGFEKQVLLFKLYRFQINRGVFADTNLTANIFGNMFIVSLSLHRAKWLLKNMKNTTRVREFEDGIFELLQARALYETQNCSKAMELVILAEKKIKGFRKNQLLQFKIQLYYELNKMDQLWLAIQTYNQYLTQELKPILQQLGRTDILQANQAFLKCCSSLCIYDTAISKTKRLQNIKEIFEIVYDDSSTEFTREEKWIEEKVESLLVDILNNSLKEQRHNIKNSLREEAKFAYFYSQTESQLSVFSSVSEKYVEANRNFLELIKKIKQAKMANKLLDLNNVEREVCQRQPLIERVQLLLLIDQIQQKE